MGILDIFKKKEEEAKKAAKNSPKTSVTQETKEPEKKKVEEKPEKKQTEEKVKKTVATEKKAVPAQGPKNTKDAYRVLVSPILTEKSTRGNKVHQYTFRVAVNANKIQVKEAVAVVYGVHPVAVNMVKYGRRKIRFGVTEGMTKQWKKAVVTLRPGETLNEKI